MDGPAKSRLRKHLQLAREFVVLYKNSGGREYLEMAEFHTHTAKEIYDVINYKPHLKCCYYHRPRSLRKWG